MSLETLLVKTRKLNTLLQEYVSDRILFSDIAKILSDVMNSNVLIISKKGKILSSIGEALTLKVSDGHIEEKLSARFNFIDNTEENAELECFKTGDTGFKSCIIPITCTGNRKGTMILYRKDKPYSIEDIIIGEYGANVIALEMLRSEGKEDTQREYRVSVVKSAISTLSYSELEAVIHIFSELNDTEGLIVASRIADKVGITRSVIVNALRKLESAGVIESKSLGMKGTYIKVLNDVLLEELNKFKK